MLQPGDQAPSFSLPDADMERVSSDQLLATGNLVLCFYPKDDTPGCTMEALEFTDLHDDFVAAGADLAGISCDTCASHGAFRDKHGLSVRLLADTDGEVCRRYGVWQEKEKNGEKRQGIRRSTFIIGRDGTIHHALYDVKPKGHAAAVLELTRGLGTDSVS
ncbi:peroxiredoxin [Thiohalocapsa marina]|uniref:thioredoxin-dependent peroxiredoxin n=1 Tax=Thiohalocapsa marina TaxID=424902 RepID=A0A5M8FP57_9GAMM|nr:peroxiredoxin [Thiohalocapsa marina]KAA6186587.1 peroxiredoxin [Thiohalocapsa marina]